MIWKQLYIFVAFHFYFLLDLFQTATLTRLCGFFISVWKAFDGEK